MKLSRGLIVYIVFCVVVGVWMLYANHIGYYPTYGLFSGENTHYSGWHSGGHGSYYIHGK